MPLLAFIFGSALVGAAAFALMPNRAIAIELSISERTVENHVFHILTKLGINSRTAAAAWAIRQGLG